MKAYAARQSPARRTKALAAFVLLWFVAIAALPTSTSPASAHPLGNFTINRYMRVEVYADTVRIAYVLDIAEIPSFEMMATIDADNNGASPAELDAWATQLAASIRQDLDVSIDRRLLTLVPGPAVGSATVGQSNLPVLRLATTFDAPVRDQSQGARTRVSVRDVSFSERLGWREIVIAPSPGAELDAPDGYTDRSLELTAYPATSLEGAPGETEVSFDWVAGSGTAAARPTMSAGSAAAPDAGGFTALIGRDVSWVTVLVSLVAAAGFGMVHALGPGHGKTVVAAYLAGRKGTPRHAVALGLTVTATHTSSVYAMGFVALVLSNYIVPDRLYLSLGVLSGLMIIGFGAALLLRRIRKTGQHVHRHGPFGLPHAHGVAVKSEPPHTHAHDENPTDWRGVLTLGVIGGLLPCPSAIVVMLSAIAFGEILFGMLLIVAFSLGLASVLTALGLAVVFGEHLVRRFGARGRRVTRFATRLQSPVLFGGPIAIIIVGCVLTLRAFEQGSGVLF